MEDKQITNLNAALFKVEQQPIYIKRSKPKVQDLFSEQGGEHFFKTVDWFQAVVDVERDYVFSVVSGNYRLITNQEAIDLGEACFKSIFSKTTSDGMEVFNIVMPKTRSFCHIDFVHKDRSIEPWEDDKWSPFLRVTNSYNRTKLLRFDLGFCRWICKTA